MIELKITNWKAVLETAKLDENVGVRIARLTFDPSFSMYIADIAPQEKINANVHPEGIIVYSILEGAGVLHVAKQIKDELIDKTSLGVMAGDFFNIDPGVAHQLENKAETPLVIMFGCPPENLEKNRMRVEDLV